MNLLETLRHPVLAWHGRAILKARAKRDRFIVDALNILRQSEGNSVLFVCDNPEFDGPNVFITCTVDFTDWQPVDFAGNDLTACLQAALDCQKAWLLKDYVLPLH